MAAANQTRASKVRKRLSIGSRITTTDLIMSTLLKHLLTVKSSREDITYEYTFNTDIDKSKFEGITRETSFQIINGWKHRDSHQSDQWLSQEYSQLYSI